MKLSEQREHRFAAFRNWLRNQGRLGELAIGSAANRTKRVERGLRIMTGDVDLDVAYQRDGLLGVLQLLNYTIDDVHNKKEPPQGITFRFGRNEPRYYERVQDVLDDLKKAVKQYRDFCDETL